MVVIGEEKQNPEKLFKKVISGNFSNIRKKTHNLIQETQAVLNIMNPKIQAGRHTVIKISNVKEKKKM